MAEFLKGFQEKVEVFKLKYRELLADAAHGFGESFWHFAADNYYKIDTLFQTLNEQEPFSIKIPREESEQLTNIQVITQLKNALQIAVKLEMTVLFEYLFACFSVINSSDEVKGDQKTDDPYLSELRREYKNQLMIICIQEMQHMRMACDMLVSIGGIPNLNQATFPSEFGSKKTPAVLNRLNGKALILFAINEMPYVPQQNLLSQGSNPEDEFTYISIAQLYSSIQQGFTTIYNQIGQSMFTPQKGMSPMKNFYTNIKKVHVDVTLIMEQGEGGEGEGRIVLELVKQFIKWLRGVNFLPGILPVNYIDAENVKSQLLSVSEKILDDINNGRAYDIIREFDKLIQLYNLLARYISDSFPIQSFRSAAGGPSHWARFIMMLINYSTLMVKFGKKINFMHDDDFSYIFSRPSCPIPEKAYFPNTKIIVDLANQSFQLLLKILQAGFIEISPDLEEQFQITKRYEAIRFYPLMTILIYPLGEILSYFQLSDKQTDKTAGFAFIPTKSDTISEPLDKFQDILGSVYAVNNAAKLLNKEFISQLGTCVGNWLPKHQDKVPVINRVKNLINHVKMAVDVIFTGFTNGIPESTIITNPKIMTPCYEPVIYDNKFYMNIEFSGYSIFSLSSDPDSTFDPRGFSGNMFMYEYTNDPDFTTYFYTQNKKLYPNPDNKFSRLYVPDINYAGVKITDVNLVIPSYAEVDNIKNDATFKKIEISLKEDLEGCPFNFVELVYYDKNNNDTKTYYPSIPMFNYALSRMYGIDPVNIDIDSKSFHLRRANLFTNPTTGDLDPSISYIDACIKYSDSFGPYPEIANDRLPQSGGYCSWKNPYEHGVGAVSKTNAINAKSGTGQTKWDYYTLYEKRNEKLKKDIYVIIDSYPSDNLAQLIKDMLQYFNSKLIVLALMINIPNKNDELNRLSYLCSRYLQMKKIMDGIREKGSFHEDSSQFFYNTPLNADDDTYFIAQHKVNDTVLDKIQFRKKEKWHMDFCLGGIDYDALTFFMTGNLMIPVTLNL